MKCTEHAKHSAALRVRVVRFLEVVLDLLGALSGRLASTARARATHRDSRIRRTEM